MVIRSALLATNRDGGTQGQRLFLSLRAVSEGMLPARAHEPRPRPKPLLPTGEGQIGSMADWLAGRHRSGGLVVFWQRLDRSEDTVALPLCAPFQAAWFQTVPIIITIALEALADALHHGAMPRIYQRFAFSESVDCS